MRLKVYFVYQGHFVVDPPRGSPGRMEHTVYQFVDADENTPIGKIIEEARSKFIININKDICIENVSFQSIFDADFQDEVGRRARLASAEAEGYRANRSAYTPAVQRQTPQPVVSSFTPQQAIDPSSDVVCAKCSSKATGYFKCKDGQTKPLCRLHCALEAVS